jgi:hypothetical protein
MVLSLSQASLRALVRIGGIRRKMNSWMKKGLGDEVWPTWSLADILVAGTSDYGVDMSVEYLRMAPTFDVVVGFLFDLIKFLSNDKRAGQMECLYRICFERQNSSLPYLKYLADENGEYDGYAKAFRML